MASQSTSFVSYHPPQAIPIRSRTKAGKTTAIPRRIVKGECISSNLSMVDPKGRGNLLPTPSRRQRAEDYDIDALLDSEIDAASRFRVGHPNPMPPLPLIASIPNYVSSEIGLDRDEWETIYTSIRDIIRSEGLAWFNVNYYQRHFKEVAPSANDNTIFIKATIHNPHSAIKLVQAIRQLLLAHGKKLSIEILDDRAREETYVAKLDRSVAQQWQLLEATILEVLGHGPEWRTLNLLNRGESKDESVPTVMVGVTDQADLEWQRRTYKLIVDIVRDLPLLDVIYCRSTFKLLGAEFRPPVVWGPEAFSGPLALGTSIGVENHTGTLGGYVKIRYNGEVHTIGLTCHHVIHSTKMSQDEEANGLGPDLTRESIDVFAPSDADREETINSYRVTVDKLEKLVDGDAAANIDTPKSGKPGLKALAEEAREVSRESDDLDLSERLAKLERNLHRALTNLDLFRRQVIMIESAHRHAGSVFASSGMTRYGGPDTTNQSAKWGWAMDWALIKIDPTRIGDNYIPKDATVGDMGDFEIIDTRCAPPNINGSDSTQLVRKGRSGYAQGEVNEIRTTINFESESPKHYGAYVVIGAPRSKSFLREGDSGSWGIDGHHFSVLGFAGEQDGPMSYATPASWVYEDVFVRTGARVIDPPVEDLCSKDGGAT